MRIDIDRMTLIRATIALDCQRDHWFDASRQTGETTERERLIKHEQRKIAEEYKQASLDIQRAMIGMEGD